MQVFCPNNVKIYNLSSGKSLPEWISERKRRLLQKKDVDVRKRIELIQDFEMPAVSNNVKVSKDGQYILATGVYKPRIRCYDVNNLSMKFERCFNAEAVQFELLSEDYSKFVLLQCDRSVEFHAQYGCYYRTRIPKFGRDMAYQHSTCDLYLVGASSEMYRLNLDQGKFLNSLVTGASSINKVSINPVHDLVVCGTVEGKVEAWDPRDRHRIGILDCALSCITEDTDVTGFPSITSLRFKDALTLAAGTATGQILLYDIRAFKPFTVRDHMNELPIKNIEFIKSENLVASVDIKCVKFWNQNTGKPYTYIQSQSDLNDLCMVPNTGLMFLANEDKKILTYYIPSMGPAPKWCYFLDNLTEELEESKVDTVYDDYKFVTSKDLEDLGLSHLVGTNLLRGYMHGYFMDIRLYNKAQSLVQPFAYKDFQKKKIREKLENERKNRVLAKQLPAVNKVLAQKLMEQQMDKGQTHKTSAILEDDRFKAMFDDPEFTIDETADEFNNIRPLLSKLDKASIKSKNIISFPHEQFEAVEEEDDTKRNSSSSESDSEEGEENSELESDDDEGKETEELKPKSQKKLEPQNKKAKLYEIKDVESFRMLKKPENEEDKMLPLEERLKQVKEPFETKEVSGGSRVITFNIPKADSQTKQQEKNRAHMKERAQFRRPIKCFRK